VWPDVVQLMHSILAIVNRYRSSQACRFGLGFGDTAERQVTLRLPGAVSLDGWKISQAETAVALSVPLAASETLRGYKVVAFSVKRLIGLLTLLGDNAEIVVRRGPVSPEHVV
jgi:hypothetical protein